MVPPIVETQIENHMGHVRKPWFLGFRTSESVFFWGVLSRRIFDIEVLTLGTLVSEFFLKNSFDVRFHSPGPER